MERKNSGVSSNPKVMRSFQRRILSESETGRNSKATTSKKQIDNVIPPKHQPAKCWLRYLITWAKSQAKTDMLATRNGICQGMSKEERAVNRSGVTDIQGGKAQTQPCSKCGAALAPWGN